VKSARTLQEKLIKIRCQSREALEVRDISDGRSGCAEAFVQRNLAEEASERLNLGRRMVNMVVFVAQIS
jgi:hypothetical protein